MKKNNVYILAICMILNSTASVYGLYRAMQSGYKPTLGRASRVTATQMRSYTSGRSGESGFKVESEAFNRIVDRANRGFMPTDQEITAFGSGRIIKFLATKLFNQVDAKGETFLTKIVNIATQSPTYENITKAKKIYDLGARLSDKTKKEILLEFPKAIADEVQSIRTNYFDVSLARLQNIARVIDLFCYIGFEATLEIDMERLTQFARIPDLSSQIAAKSINQLKALSKNALYNLLSQDPSFEPWWITGKTEVRYLFFSHTTPNLLEAACFVKDLPQQSNNYQQQENYNQQQNNEQQQQYQQQGEAYFRQQYEELQRQQQRQREQEEYNRQQYEQQRQRYRQQQEQQQRDQYAEQQWREQRQRQEEYNRQQQERERQQYEQQQRYQQQQNYQQQDNNQRQRQDNRYGQNLTDAQKIENLKDALREAMPALSQNASAKMIRTSFLKYMVRNHPDAIRNDKSLSSTERARRLEELKSITDAYNDAKESLDKAIRAAGKK